MLLQLFNQLSVEHVLRYPLLPALYALVLVTTFVLFRIKAKARPSHANNSNTPPMLPYKIPFIGETNVSSARNFTTNLRYGGHTISFLMNSERLICYGREFFGNTRGIFSIVLFGKRFHIVTDPHHVAIIHSKPATFEFTGVLKTALIALGASKEAATNLWNPRDTPDGPQKGVIPLSHEYQIRQNSGADLKVLVQRISEFLEEQTSPQNIALAEVTRNGAKGLSVMDWARENVIHAMQDVYFGPKLHEIDSSLPRAMMDFSDLAWQAWYHVPWFLRRRQIKLCDRILTSYQRYLDTPTSGRKTSAWFTEMFERDFKKVLRNDTDKAALMMFFHWGIAMNPADTTGWLVAHILSDANLAETIRQETAPAFREDGSLDTFYLINSCPVLVSVWYEVLRLYISVTTMRNVTEDVHIGDCYIKKGSSLMFSARQLSSNEEVFGENYADFDPMRFLRNPKLRHSESLRPFGGGKTICPGRHLAKHVATAIVAILLRRYNMSLAFPQPFPKPFEGEPSIGVLRTRDELILKLEERDCNHANVLCLLQPD